MEFCVLVVLFALAFDIRKRICACRLARCGGAEMNNRLVFKFKELRPDEAAGWGFRQTFAIFVKL